MSRFDSESLNAPHTQRHLDEIPQRTAPSVEQMTDAALDRNSMTDERRKMLRSLLATKRDLIEYFQSDAASRALRARQHMIDAMIIRRELGE